MKKSSLILLIIATSLCLVGLIIFVSVMTVCKWDFLKLNTEKAETKTYYINEDFGDISISGTTESISFKPCKIGDLRVVCETRANTKTSVKTEDGKLTVKTTDDRKWYEHFGIFFGQTKITLYIPEGRYGKLVINNKTGSVTIPKQFSFESIDIDGSTGNVDCKASVGGDLSVKLSTGNISIENITASCLDLKTSTGNISLLGLTLKGDILAKVSTGNISFKDIKCGRISSSGSTGNVSFENVLSGGKVNIKRTTGHIKLKNSDAKELYLKTSTGDITGSLLSKKVFLTDTSTGTVSVPKTAEGGKCEITTGTGDINFSINTLK